MMRKDQILSSLSYVAVGAVAILVAFWISSALLKPASTQENLYATIRVPKDAPAPGSSTPTNNVPAQSPNNQMAQDPQTMPPVDQNLSSDDPQNISGDTPPIDPAFAEGSESEQNLGLEKAQLRTEVQSFLEPFIYDPKGRRDPFKPYSEIVLSDGSDGPVGPVMPLQRFDLDQLRLIGIIWDVKDPKAMFLDPNSRIYTIGRDERIGPNNGYVAAIREGEVVVIETFRRREGDPIYTPRVLRMER